MGAGTREAERLARQQEELTPILVRAGDNTVLLNGRPPLVDCRVLAEVTYQRILSRGSTLQQKTISDLMDERDKLAREVKRLEGHISSLLGPCENCPVEEK